jgi:hypothetical protein
MDMENPLLGPEAVPQKFFSAQAALANFLGPRPAFVRPFQKPADLDGRSTANVHGYAFDGPEGAVLIAWAPGVLNTGKRGLGGVIHLGESPVYLISSTMSALDLAEAGTLAYSTAFNGWTLSLPEGVEARSIVGSPIGK